MNVLRGIMHFVTGMSLIDPPAPKNEGETLRVGMSTSDFPTPHVLDFVKSLDKRRVLPNCIGHCDPKLTDPYNESDTLP